MAYRSEQREEELPSLNAREVLKTSLFYKVGLVKIFSFSILPQFHFPPFNLQIWIAFFSICATMVSFGHLNYRNQQSKISLRRAF